MPVRVFRASLALALPLLASIAPSVARAATTDMPALDGAEPARAADVRAAIPNATYAYSATGADAGSVGAQAFGLGLAGAGQRATLGGGARAWGAPIDRLTLVGEASRDLFGQLAPSAAAIVRLYGKADMGWSLGALGKFKIDGFGVGPHEEIESEWETGLLASYARRGWHADANAIVGVGLGDDGEVDSEARLRLGRDLGPIVRVGVDGQARLRVHGDNALSGGRTWDFAAGPQLVIGTSGLFGVVSAGPATMGMAGKDVGWTAFVSIGAVKL